MQNTTANDLEPQIQNPKSKNQNQKRHLLRIASAVWAALILLGSVLPGLPGMPFPGSDKVEHAFAYGVLALLFYLALATPSIPRRVLFGMAGAWGYGAAIEAVQLPIRWRTVDPADLLANLIGAVAMAAGILLVCGPLRQSR